MVALFGGQREGPEIFFSTRWFLRKWPWLREIGFEFVGHHREVGQRASADEFDRVVEHAKEQVKVQGLSLAEGILRRRRRAGGPLGKEETFVWEDGVCAWTSRANHGRSHRGETEMAFGLTRNGLEEKQRGQDGNRNLEMIVAVSVARERRRCQDGWIASKVEGRDDGRGVQGEGLEMEEHVLVPKGVYMAPEGLGGGRIHREMHLVHVIAQGMARTSAHRQKNCRRRTEEELRGHCEGGCSTKGT